MNSVEISRLCQLTPEPQDGPWSYFIDQCGYSFYITVIYL